MNPSHSNDNDATLNSVFIPDELIEISHRNPFREFSEMDQDVSSTVKAVTLIAVVLKVSAASALSNSSGGGSPQLR